MPTLNPGTNLLQPAIDALVPGETLTLNPGVHQQSGSVSVFTDDVTIEAPGGATIRSSDWFLLVGDRVAIRGGDLLTTPLNFDVFSWSGGTKPSWFVVGADCTLDDYTITNANQSIGMAVGDPAEFYGPTKVGDRFIARNGQNFLCGTRPNSDHGVYHQIGNGALFEDVAFWGNASRGIQLFVGPTNGTYRRCLVDRNGQGITVGNGTQGAPSCIEPINMQFVDGILTDCQQSGRYLVEDFYGFDGCPSSPSSPGIAGDIVNSIGFNRPGTSDPGAGVIQPGMQGWGTLDITQVDPGYVGNGDFQLSSGSPAEGFGPNWIQPSVGTIQVDLGAISPPPALGGVTVSIKTRHTDNKRYPAGSEKILAGEVDFLSDVLRFVAVDAPYVFDEQHEFLSDIPAAQRIASSGVGTSPSVTGGIFRAQFGPSTGGTVIPSTLSGWVLYKDTGLATTSPLLVYVRRDRDMTLLSIPMNGSNIQPDIPNDGIPISATYDS